MDYLVNLFDNAGEKLQRYAKTLFFVKLAIYLISTVIGVVYLVDNYEEELVIWLVVACFIVIVTDYLFSIALVGLGKIVENAEGEMRQRTIIKAVASDSQEEKAPFKLQINNETSDFSQDFLFSLPAEKRRELKMYISSHKMGKITDEIFEREKNRILSDEK